MKNIFELKYNRHYSAEEFTDCVKFYEKIGYDVLIEFLTTHDKDELLSVNHLLKHANDEFIEYLEDQYSWYYDEDECTFEEFKEEFIIEDDFNHELYEFLIDYLTDDQLGWILSEIGVKIGTAGYSPWSYYIALEDIKDDFIEDIYNGYNMYDIIQYDEAGDFLDALHMVYAPNTSDLIACINGYFILNKDDYIYIEENEASMYIEHEKIKKVQTYYEKRFVI